MKYDISLFNNVLDNNAKEVSFTFDEILGYFGMVCKGVFEEKGKLPSMVCGTFLNKKRTAKNLNTRSILTYDIDYYKFNLEQLITLLKESLKGHRYIYYTTSSSTYDKPKMRLLVFINKVMTASEYKIISENVAHDLLPKMFDKENFTPNNSNSTFDKCSYSPSQLMLVPCKVNADFTSGCGRGMLVNIEGYIDKIENSSAKPMVKSLPLTLVSDERVKNTLEKYDVETTDYHGWFTVCQALHHQYGGGDKGLDIFLEWSLKDSRFKPSDINAEVVLKYKSVRSDCDRPITFASVIKVVNDMIKATLTNDNVDFSPVSPVSSFADVKTNKHGVITSILSTYRNFKIMCDSYDIKISYDIITKGFSTNLGERNKNNVVTILQSAMVANGMDKGMASSYAHLMADRNISNSFETILDAVIWDGVDRLEPFYNTVGVADQHIETRNLYLLKWLQQMLYLTLHKGKRKIARNLLVFQGGQHGGKSTWLMSLMPDHLMDYVGEGLVLDTNCSTNMLKCLKKIFVELGELEQSFKKTDINQFKAFFGRTRDELNIKYLPEPVTYLRTTSFLATVNEVSFLKDKTGSTRFLTLPITKLNGYHKIDMLQLYKQIVVDIGYINFELSEEQREKQRILNQDFEQPDIIDEHFTNIFETEFDDGGVYQNCTEVLEQIGYHKRDVKHNIRCDIANVLRKYKFLYRKDLKKWRVKLKSNT